MLYLAISNYKGCHTGAGGHYYSLLVLYNALKEFGTKVEVIVFGDEKPIALDVIDDEYIQVVKVLGLLPNLRNLKVESEDIIHSFDPVSHFSSRVISIKSKCKLVYTKPGGPNSKKSLFGINRNFYVPYSKDIICFSRENFDFISNKYRDVNLHLIPNRVGRITSDNTRIQELKEKIGIEAGTKVLLRICRIGTDYKRSIEQTIALADFFEMKGESLVTLIIGRVQHEDVYEDLLRRFNEAHFITDDYFCRSASELIDIADYVVGTGRSFMEACYFDKVAFVPVNNSNMAVLVTDSNFERLFRNNFSPRNVATSAELEMNETAIKMLNTGFYRSKFDKFFGINGVLNKYLKIYENAKETRLDYKFFHHFLVQSRFLTKYYLKKFLSII
ncbi:hypothetical protein [Shewanella chilikensis]|uniref:hypothetical protein n=1 Tax=Shewanella chilikensis TaxID=558541 RepID=UPI001CD1E3D8|nr:hypothetical protein [Shewanella chilikensis]MCA0950242.1 hypothetical protein [Shewanella chilikensis]